MPPGSWRRDNDGLEINKYYVFHRNQALFGCTVLIGCHLRRDYDTLSNMQNGVYRVIFRGPVGEGRGVIAAKGGALWGGDTGFVYQGSYAAEDGKASIQVKKDDPNFPGVFGPLNDFRLDLTLQVTTSGFIAVGAVPGQPNLQIAITAVKMADL
jgi:hypothetical protein